MENVGKKILGAMLMLAGIWLMWYFVSGRPFQTVMSLDSLCAAALLSIIGVIIAATWLSITLREFVRRNALIIILAGGSLSIVSVVLMISLAVGGISLSSEIEGYCILAGIGTCIAGIVMAILPVLVAIIDASRQTSK